MTIFFQILLNNVLPLSVMIAVGVILQRAFSLDIKTLSKLNFYLFSPAIMFQLIYETPISVSAFGQVMLFIALFMAVQFAAVELVIRARGYGGGMKAAMRNSVLFYNSANYGIPLNQLVFAGNPFTLSVQVLVMMVQNLVPNTYGVYNVNAHKADWKAIRRIIVSMPSIYVIPLAFAMRGLEIPLPNSLYTPVGYLASAFIGTALITLGVQLGSMSWRISRSLAADVGFSVCLRLLAGPALAWLIILALTPIIRFDELTAAALILSSAVPTSLSSVLLAVEFDNEAEFASQAVFVSTVLSVVTVTVVIYMLNVQM
ncbi:transporter [Paenibacillus darwinianus]|uniref:Transporter n=1 Tax=Paenibacillus darwinianus TaxID=1380763 RepID=A0A9W5W7M0_9BACL|nr:AEC family transporter [Paenibacillus darwinianus]EXX87687.1 transporter [Paenibacillus darwinianus]EXX89302.1 transporter [Paenibacillus darwinianus]EXX90117.1 transporter [Paenibacillus darwinianus]